MKHVCTTADRVGKQIMKAAKKIDWKKVAIVATATVAAVAVTVATAGAAGPLIAAGVSGFGLSGAAATVVTAAAVGATAGAAGGAVSSFTTSVLSGDKPKDILANTWNGAVNGFVAGGATGGLLGGFGAATSSVSGSAARYAVDTLGETAVDTIVDAAQGGKITPASIATSLAINAVSEGVSARSVKTANADVPKNKPKAGDVPVTKPRKDVTPVQQLALPGPKSQPLALPAPKSTPKTDFYVRPSGDIIPATGYRYMSSDASYLPNLKNTMEIPSNPSNTYISFYNYDIPNPGALQVPHDAAIKATFDTKQILDDVRVPNGNWGKASYPEPLTTDFPNFGPGGATQAITNKQIKIDSLTDLRNLP
ncbi:TPA: hypothetical protein U1C23_002303 [Streptococcus suis]|nr:hypothetical protein [Streptococcus suis]